MNWAALFAHEVPLPELIVRGSAIYWFLFVIFRFVLRRDVGSIGIADVLLLVVIADAAQNAMSGPYTTITDGVILISTIVAWNWLLDWSAYHSRVMRRLVMPRPLVIVREGKLCNDALRKELLSQEEIETHIRVHGVEHIKDVKVARLEGDGQISVVRFREARSSD